MQGLSMHLHRHLFPLQYDLVRAIMVPDRRMGFLAMLKVQVLRPENQSQQESLQFQECRLQASGVVANQKISPTGSQRLHLALLGAGQE